ncbi:MAG: magnesium transporter [Mycoplasma sp.]
MALINKKKNTVTLMTHFNKYYKNLDISQTQKVFRNTASNLILDTLNEMEDIKQIIFVLVAGQKIKPLRLVIDLDYDLQKELLLTATDSELKLILKHLYPDDLFELINEHKEASKRIYLCIDAERRKVLKQISSYDEDEIGHIMNPKFMVLNETWTVKKAITYVKSEIKNVESTNWIFVTNDDNKLLGVIRLYDLFFASNQRSKISSVMDKDFISVDEKAEIEDVINMFDKYSIEILAVIDSKNSIVGIIRNSDITAAIQDETTEDIYKMYGITQLHTPYLHTSSWKIARSRLLWLSILMISATMTSVVLDQFQGLSETLTSGISTIILVPLLPVLTGTSGNAGSQASASIIRSLSIGDITHGEYWKAIRKEIKVGLIIGAFLALINFIRLIAYYAIFTGEMMNTFNDNPSIVVDLTWNQLFLKNLIVALSSSFTLFCSILIAKILGSSLPILATKFNIDPTVMSAPILATVLDVTTTTVLFGVGISVVASIF